ncbi:STAS/SEC14 domain-containing protein [Bernardetia sp.]|uniref:STAS/SEC14 domain-containing protein n=1 Tax=Bernardetia sp. TaxID=1937974 RepID=UPI0025C11D02|nr:STAS/SEC14 domain-containing protein [Bernardetia sp.]
MQVYNSNFLQIDAFDDQKLLELTWLKATVDMTDEEYRNEHLELLKFMLEQKTQKVVGNVKDLGFVVNPDTQEWMNINVFVPAIEVGFHKLAVVMSSEFLAQLSIEQVMEEKEGQKITTQYFDNVEEAREWIMM